LSSAPAQRPPGAAVTGAQDTWLPGNAFGLGTAVAGLRWTPLPVLRDGATPRVHWAGPVALAALALPFVLLAAWARRAADARARHRRPRHGRLAAHARLAGRRRHDRRLRRHRSRANRPRLGALLALGLV
jgi:hypothetical protein